MSDGVLVVDQLELLEVVGLLSPPMPTFEAARGAGDQVSSMLSLQGDVTIRMRHHVEACLPAPQIRGVADRAPSEGGNVAAMPTLKGNGTEAMLFGVLILWWVATFQPGSITRGAASMCQSQGFTLRMG